MRTALAYNKGMKKTVLAISMAVMFGFVSAVVLCIRALVAPQTVFSAEAVMKVVLDAGHGGIDGGVVGVQTGVKESDLNLQITHLLKSELEEVGFENQGVNERTNLAVLRRTQMPAVRVEVGFINTDADNALLDARFDDVVQAIADGILETVY